MTAQAATNGCSVSYTISSQWPGGFGANVAITNLGSPISSWSLNWSFSAGNWFWGSPVVSSGTVYAASLDHKVYAIDAATGEAKWQHPFEAGAPVRSSPVLDSR